jgi:ankyrin repeat protein
VKTFLQAAHNGDVEGLIQALPTVNVNVCGRIDLGRVPHIGTALHFASRAGKLDAVRWLLAQEGIDVNHGGWTMFGHSPLQHARGEAVVEALIAAGADVNHQGRMGGRVLTCHTHNINNMRRLIKAGARVNDVFNDATLLDRVHVESRYFGTAPVNLLLEYRAMPCDTRLPPLHTRLVHSTGTPFSMSPEETLPEVLSEKDAFGRTALHYAALTGDREAYTVLHAAMKRARVDTDGVDGGGYTAFDHLVRVNC